jgi:hypothetical protein
VMAIVVKFLNTVTIATEMSPRLMSQHTAHSTHHTHHTHTHTVRVYVQQMEVVLSEERGLRGGIPELGG